LENNSISVDCISEVINNLGDGGDDEMELLASPTERSMLKVVSINNRLGGSLVATVGSVSTWTGYFGLAFRKSHFRTHPSGIGN